MTEQCSGKSYCLHSGDQKDIKNVDQIISDGKNLIFFSYLQTLKTIWDQIVVHSLQI